MQYMMLVYFEEQQLDEATREHCYAESLELVNELNANGRYLAAAPLYPVSRHQRAHSRG